MQKLKIKDKKTEKFGKIEKPVLKTCVNDWNHVSKKVSPRRPLSTQRTQRNEKHKDNLTTDFTDFHGKRQ